MVVVLDHCSLLKINQASECLKSFISCQSELSCTQQNSRSSSLSSVMPTRELSMEMVANTLLVKLKSSELGQFSDGRKLKNMKVIKP